MKLKDTAAIVTGGASGMGLATAKLLSEQGARVAIFDANQEALNKASAAINVMPIYCDVTKEHDVAEGIKLAADQHGPARICINCAGIVQAKRMLGKQGPLPLDEFRRVIEINLIGTFNVMRLAAAGMLPLEPLTEVKERGVMINTASVAAFEGQIGQAAYSASKGGIVGMMLPIARELAQFGIRIVTIAPGLINTPLFDKISPEARASLEASVPFPKRLGRPEEFATLALHIIDNQLLNGCVIRLDGALRMQPT